MRKFLITGLLLLMIAKGFAQVRTNTAILQQDAQIQAGKEAQLFTKLLDLSKKKGWPMVRQEKNGRFMRLAGIDNLGFPLYLTTVSNVESANTIGTSTLWPGGSTGLSLNGSSNFMTGKMGVWDAGLVRGTHVELTGRILQKDNTSALNDHTTHVAGTLIATGVNPVTKGMAFGLKQLIAYDFNNDMSEMLNEAPYLLVSNHSYTYLAGWSYNDNAARWEFWGAPNATEDYKFGYYSSETQIWDSIAYNAPYYLMVKAVGNNRNENGPAVGNTYWRMDNSGNFYNAGKRPAGISNNDGYDIISTTGTAKNILSVGAVGAIQGGYSQPSDVQITAFSSWGPTDDGRIKPDVVADGLYLTSCISTSDNAYATYSGTSMASPSAAGSLFLLQELYAQKHSGAFLRSATIKGLAIHTADEAGVSPGPDYVYGWGLLDIKKAASVITSNNTDQLIIENVLNNGETKKLDVVASGKQKLIATICWTDPKGSVENTNTLNNPAKKLVNDLDIRIKKNGTIYYPWILNPAMPSAPATKGDNITDNVERVEIDDVAIGDTYTIEVSHKGTLQRGSQAYSLIVSGVGGTAYCTSAAINTAGTRIDSVSVGTGIRNKNVAGCTTYNNYKILSTDIEPGQVVPVSVKTNSCDATNAKRIIKVYIDYNKDGTFDENTEMVAKSTALNNNDIFSANINTPATLITGTTMMRIVAMETTNDADVKACGTYPNGETQDYTVNVVTSTDAGISDILSPVQGACANPAQYVVVNIKNYGLKDITNIPLSATVKDGTNTIVTLTGSYSATIAAGSSAVYTFSTPFATAAGKEYTITVTTQLTGDQNTSNNSLENKITINTGSTITGAKAEICGNGKAVLSISNGAGSGDVYNWYDSPTATTPFTTGDSVITTTIPTNKTFYVAKNNTKLNIGPADRTTLSNKGQYFDLGTNATYFQFSNQVPVTIENLKLYVQTAGKVTLTVGNITASTDSSFSYLPISSKTIDVFQTKVSNTIDDGAVFYTNLPVNDTGKHILIITTQNAVMYLNSGITSNPYPFTIPGIFSITGNNFSNYQNVYMFLYNINLRINSCSSDRIAITATTAPQAPLITLNGNILQSSLETGNQWYIGDSLLPGATLPTYTAIKYGLYKTIVNSAGGCTLSSNVVAYPFNSDPNNIYLKISPNPTGIGKVTVQFVTPQQTDVEFALFNAMGQRVYSKTYTAIQSNFTGDIPTGNLSAGVYVLRMKINGNLYTNKIVVE